MRLSITAALDYQQDRKEDVKMNKKIRFYNYHEARDIVKQLGITSHAQYKTLHHLDGFLPARPDIVYLKAGWIDWFDFLGKPRSALYATYDEAKTAVQKIGPSTRTDYQKKRRKDSKLPSHPHLLYAGKGWVSWQDFLSQQPAYSTFDDAKNAARRLGIKNQSQYAKLRVTDSGLPRHPDIYYSNSGWKGWHDFLGVSKSSSYTLYAQAQNAVHALNITSGADYRRRYTLDPKLPRHPNVFYAGKGWVNWCDFTGKTRSFVYTRYAQAQKAAQTLNLKNWTDYRKRYHEDAKLPAQPQVVYANKGWTNWYDFLGNRKPQFYESYALASAAARALGIVTSIEYVQRYQEDPRLPSSPANVYHNNGWSDWYSFLGRSRPAFYEDYQQARAAVRAINIKSYSDYKSRYREDARLPSWPNVTYADSGWAGWPEFLGTDSELSVSYGRTWAVAQLWLCSQQNVTIKKRAIKSVIQGVLKQNNLADEPGRFAERIYVGCELYRKFLKNQPRARLNLLASVAGEFSAWLRRIGSKEEIDEIKESENTSRFSGFE